MYDSELDIQITTPRFVVDREPNPDWSITRTMPVKDDREVMTCVLAYAKSGSAIYSFNGGKRHTVTRGNVLFIRKGERYAGASDPADPWSFYSCEFGLIPGNAESCAIIDSLPHIFRCSDSTHMREDFAQLTRAWSAKQTGYLIKCRSMLLDILFILLWDEHRRSIQSAHYKTIDDIVETMRENYSRTYSLEELASLSGLSTSYFRMLFKQMTGCTTVQFQNRLKIDKAKDLILSRTCNVSEAAQAVGFSDVFYFSRTFKKLTGKNPSEYIE
ncbi:MAG: helix-turn-helix domain-containing protein [Ruminococcaceae bacterium]|nr:helix-turn-helix domain-containing protein [Oscillospiraceae bacterium]